MKSAGIILFVALMLLEFSCEERPTPPVLGSVSVEGGTSTSIVAVGYVLTDGGSPITVRGICCDTSKNPTTANVRTVENGLPGSFSSTLKHLLPNTLYYIRAYATNKEGTGYGQETSYTTGQSIINISTNGIYSVTPTSAVISANITADEGAQITRRGVCWGNLPNPTIDNQKTIDGSGVGSFDSNLSGLIPQTKYFVRLYVESTAGILYSDEFSFKTYFGSATDTDNNKYYSVLIGTQEWLANNLKVTRYNNGDLIGTTTPATFDIRSETNPKYQWAYNGDENSSSIYNESTVSAYGRLYTWFAVTDNRKICPVGWHIPDNSEWSVLIDYLGGEAVAGGKLKENPNYHWENPNQGASDEVGFDARAGGYRDPSGSFLELDRTGMWWSTTSYSLEEAPLRECSFLNPIMASTNYPKATGCSVRCIKDKK